MARILVASDDPELRSLVGAELLDDAHQVNCAVSGEEAVRLLTAGPLDLVLADCTLFGEKAEFLAARVASRFGLPVILMTGDPQRLVRIERRSLPVLAKPVSPTEMRTLLTRTLAAPIAAATAKAGDRDAARRGLDFLKAGRSLLDRRLARIAGVLFDRLVREYRCDGLRFEIPRNLTTLEFRGQLLLDGYEVPERTLTGKYVAEDATVLELGGCLGVVSCLVNRVLADPRRHVVFEAHPQIAPVLERNRARNGCRFQVRQQIISAAQSATFYLRDPFIGGSSTARLSHRKIAVPTTTIARVEEETGFAFDTWVVDIEGGEHAFLIENSARLADLRLLVIEMHPHIIGEPACTEIRGRLAAAGLARRETLGHVEAWLRP